MEDLLVMPGFLPLISSLKDSMLTYLSLSVSSYYKVIILFVFSLVIIGLKVE